MAQVEVRLSRKPYSRGESTEARINREIQMASLCNCSVGEITAKLVSRIRLVTPHMVTATNMRMIICFMIFLSSGNPPRVWFAHLKGAFTFQYWFSKSNIPGQGTEPRAGIYDA